MDRLKRFLRAVLPYPILYVLRAVRGIYPGVDKLWTPFDGDYASFEEAAGHAVGYDDAEAAGAAADRLAQMVAETNPVEIDGRFQQVHSALCVARERLQKTRITVLDFGGGNGAYFFRLKDYFPDGFLDWHVVETPHMVAACSPIGGGHITFLKDIPAERIFDVAVVSGALQYLPDAYIWLERIAHASKWIILTRLPVQDGPVDKFMVQTVTSHIHVGSMPIEIFSAAKMQAAIDAVGTVEMSWRVALDEGSLATIGARPMGFLIKNLNPA